MEPAEEKVAVTVKPVEAADQKPTLPVKSAEAAADENPELTAKSVEPADENVAVTAKSANHKSTPTTIKTDADTKASILSKHLETLTVATARPQVITSHYGKPLYNIIADIDINYTRNKLLQYLMIICNGVCLSSQHLASQLQETVKVLAKLIATTILVQIAQRSSMSIFIF